MNNKKKVAIVGNGPAGLMAAYLLISEGIHVDVFDKNSGMGRKLLIAGSSGLNIGNNRSIEEFCKNIKSDAAEYVFEHIFASYFTQDWLDFLHQQLQLKTFLGTSNRFFLEEMNSAKLIQRWTKLLQQLGVCLNFNTDVIKIILLEHEKFGMEIATNSKYQIFQAYDAIGFYAGGGSWLDHEASWPKPLKELGYEILPFSSANAGIHLDEYDSSFFKEVAFQPLKDCLIKTRLGEKQGDVILTNYGMEGTPIYHVGCEGLAYIDFIPQKSVEEICLILNKIEAKENLMMIRRIKKIPGLNKIAHAVIFHGTKGMVPSSNEEMSQLIKNFPLKFGKVRPLTEAISSHGGLSMKELSGQLMSKKHPGLFFGGEMLNWSAPTGGYLIQTCISQGAFSAHGIIKYLKEKK